MIKTLFCFLLSLLCAKALATDQIRATKAFDAIKIDGPFKTIISRDKISSLTLSGDDEILPWIRSEVKNGQLIISIKPGVKPHYSKRVIINIKAPTVDTIYGVNHASIEAENLRADNLSIGLDNHSSLKAQGAQITQTTTLTLINHSKVVITGSTNQLILAGNNHSSSIADDFDAQSTSITLINHSTAKVSSKQVTTNESNHSLLKLSEGLTKINGHLQNHSSINAPKESGIESFVNNDSEFG